MVKRLRRRPLTAESGVRFPMEVPKPSIRAHLALFFRVQTSVIYVIVNSLVFSLESPRSAPFSSVFTYQMTHLALFFRVQTSVIYVIVNSLAFLFERTLSTPFSSVFPHTNIYSALFSYPTFGHLRHCKLPRFLIRKYALYALLLGFHVAEYLCSFPRFNFARLRHQHFISLALNSFFKFALPFITVFR